MTAKLRPGLPNDYLGLSGKMRPDDYREVLAATGVDPYNAMEISWRRSTESWAMICDYEVVGVGGVCPATEEIGTPWALFSDLAMKHWRTILRHVNHLPRSFLKDYKKLMNVVDARNVVSVKWLEKGCGFTIHEAKPFGPQGLPFHLFTMER